MSRSRLVLILALGLGALGGCEDDPAIAQGDIVPGSGASVGGQVLLLGQTADEVTAALGQPDATRDLGPAGARAVYSKHHLTVHYSAAPSTKVTAIHLGSGASSKIHGELGLGSDQAAAKARLGAPMTDPFQGDWWYDAGVVLQWDSGKLVGIQIMAAAAKP